MKQIKVLFAFIFAFGLTAGLSAFRGEEKNLPAAEKKSTDTRGAGSYRYTISSQDIEDLREPLHWVSVTEQDDPCAEGDDIPCFVNYTGSDFDADLSTISYNNLMLIAGDTKPAE